jgi:hypothetical protein
MKLLKIIQAIEQHRGHRPRAYTSWAIGNTSEPDRVRKSVHQIYEDRRWLCLQADSQADAHDVEKHFRDLGMRNGRGLEPSGRCVFVYYRREV